MDKITNVQSQLAQSQYLPSTLASAQILQQTKNPTQQIPVWLKSKNGMNVSQMAYIIKEAKKDSF